MQTPIITIKTHNDVLRKTSREVALVDIPSDHIRDVTRRMSETLKHTKDGIGIAAPQIGALLRIFIASEEALYTNEDRPEEKLKKDWKHFIFINPEIINTSKAVVSGPEGCLSIPGVYGEVPRALKVRVRAYDAHGKVFERGASGLFARLIQHEVDHLNGALFTDHATHTTTRGHEG